MKNELNKCIGLRIREKRENAKMSRDKLAECIGISPQFLAQIELGNKGMSSATLHKICSALSISADYIIMGRREGNNLSGIDELLDHLDVKYLPYAEELIRTLILAINHKI